MLAQEKEAAGGYAQGLNIMVNGQCLHFDAGQARLEDGRAMAPLEELAAALGARVEYQGENTVNLYIGSDLAAALTVGENRLELPGETAALDAAPYREGGTLMVPVAAVARALGYQVYWDGTYETAVALDTQALSSQAQDGLDLMWRLLNAMTAIPEHQEGQSIQQKGNLELELKLLGGLAATGSYTVVIDSDSLTADQAASGSMTVDLAELGELVSALGASQEDMGELGALFARHTLTYIQDNPGGCIYLQGSLMDLLMAAMGMEAEEGAWTALPVPTVPGGLLDVEGALKASLSTVIAADPFHAWDVITTTLSVLKETMGDDCFVQEGEDYVLSWDNQTLLNTVLEGEGYDPKTLTQEELDQAAEEYGLPQNWELSLRITPQGDNLCAYSLSMNLEDEGNQVTMDLKGTSQGMDLQALFRLAGVVEVGLSGSAETQVTDTQPESAPPQDAQIVYPQGNLGMGMLGTSMLGM